MCLHCRLEHQSYLPKTRVEYKTYGTLYLSFSLLHMSKMDLLDRQNLFQEYVCTMRSYLVALPKGYMCNYSGLPTIFAKLRG
jgi:hypothetical protein